MFLLVMMLVKRNWQIIYPETMLMLGVYGVFYTNSISSFVLDFYQRHIYLNISAKLGIDVVVRRTMTVFYRI